MKRYAKIIDEETKEVQVGVGCPDEYYIEIGMTIMDVEQAYNGNWYLVGYVPEEPIIPPTYEEVKKKRKGYRQEHIDDYTTERTRKLANKTWTEQDEQEYLALDAEVTAWIEKNLPYPVGG